MSTSGPSGPLVYCYIINILIKIGPILIPFHSGQVRNFYLLVPSYPGTSIKKIDTILFSQSCLDIERQ